MIDLTNPAIATVIGVIVGFLLSQTSELIRTHRTDKSRRLGAYMHLNEVLKRMDAYDPAPNPQIREQRKRDLERIMVTYRDVLDKQTLRCWLLRNTKTDDLADLANNVRQNLERLTKQEKLI